MSLPTLPRPTGAPGRLLPLLFLLFLAGTTLFGQGIKTERNYIRVDQFGYLPNAKKVAVIADPINGFNSQYGINLNTSQNVQLRRASDNVVVYQALARAWNGGNTDGHSGDKGWWFDFTSYTTPGEYYIRVTKNGGGTVNSNRFRIASDVYDVVLKKAMNMFYYQRCVTNKNGNFASGNQWTDGNWYNQDQNARFIYDDNWQKDLRGGWIDAGDPNKYVTFATPVVHNLLTSYDQHPGLWNGVNLDIPESNNSVPDILDEVKFELDWIRRMQNSDGGVHQKVGIVGDKGYVNPPSTDSRTRYFNEVCVNSTITTSGMFAHAAKTFYDAGVLNSYANDLSTRAINAWNYYENSGNKGQECDPSGGRRIEAGDGDGPGQQYSNEHVAEATVAAIYLYALTGEAKYNNFVKNNYQSTRPYVIGNDAEWDIYRGNQGEALLYYAQLPNADATVKNNILNRKRSSAKSSGTYYSVQENQNLYRARARYLAWGSTSLMSRNGADNMDFINYNLNSGSHGNYRERAQSIVNFMHGTNPFGIVFLSNMYGEGAEFCADEMWHTWFTDGSQYDGKGNGRVGPPPGFLSGGINSSLTYNCRLQVGTDLFSGQFTNQQPEQKRWTVSNTYVAGQDPWAFSEPAIYYNASYVKMLASVIVDGGGGNTPPPPALTDDIVSTSVPTTVQRGNTVTVTVNYEASTDRDVIMNFQLGQSPWTTYRNVRRQVSAGSGTLSIDMAIPNNVPVASNAYQFHAYITTRGGNWSSRLDNLNKKNVSVTAAPSLSNKITSLTAGNNFTPGGTLTATVNYESNGNHDVFAVLQYDGDPNYSWVAPGIRKQVSAGTGTLTFNLKPRTNTPVRNDAYQVNIFITTRGGNWSNRFDFRTKKDLDCLNPAPSTTNQWIYRDSRASGWANWSWGTNRSVTESDTGVKKNGSSSFKLYAPSGGGISFRHDNGFTTNDLNSVRFWVRSWNSNYNSSFQVRWNNDDGTSYKTVAVTPTWQQVSYTKAQLENLGWIQRMLWTVPAGKTLFVDDVRFVYNTSSQGVVDQAVNLAAGGELQDEATLDVFPNPNNGQFTVVINSPKQQEISLQLYDLNGRPVDRVKVNGFAGENRLRMDLRSSDLPAGIYLLRAIVPGAGTQLTKRISIR